MQSGVSVKMRVVAYGAKDRTSLLISLLGKVPPLAEVTRIEDVEGMLAIDPFDCDDIGIVFVDESFKDSAKIFRYLHDMCVLPVVILASKDYSNWEEFFGANGYLDLSSDSALTLGRLKSVLRRLPEFRKLVTVG
jgi:hypothetical protein